MEPVSRRQGGRPKKADPCAHRYSVSFNDIDNYQLKRLFEQSGMRVVAHFIAKRVLDRPIKVVTFSSDIHQYYIKLSEIKQELRRIGVNYNQTVKAVNANFSEKAAAMLLTTLTRQTAELTKSANTIIQMTNSLTDKWLQG